VTEHEQSALILLSQVDIDDIFERAAAGRLSDEEQMQLQRAFDELLEGMPSFFDILSNLVDNMFGGWIFGEVFGDIRGAVNEFISMLGIDVEIPPTYRTEPIPGAELGGLPRNPEADVIDEIDKLVDWQMKNGEK
jgi:hypothetical protein